LLKKLRLEQYKGFKSFTAHFGEHVLLMGPNNAGKSTLINAVRLCGAASRVAMRVRPRDVFRDQQRTVLGYRTSQIQDDGFNFENIAHEFEAEENRLDLYLTSGAVIHMIWPLESESFFWVEHDGSQVTNAARAKEVLVRIGLVPTLTPIERQEKALSREHLNAHLETKLASRHFRNNMRAAKELSAEDYRELVHFMLANTPEISSIDIEENFRDGAGWLDFYYRHPDSRVRKELFWAGDGLQIWLQLLFHIWRTRGNQVVILDEPDVFLHPDLQRRMVRVVEASGRQTVLASHAAEVASEAGPSSLVWIERGRRSSKRINDDAALEQISAVLGSAFNLSIARALRAKTALFVEGTDMKVLRVLAKKVGAPRFAAEDGMAIVPIGGFSHWPSVEAFSWIKSSFLGSQVKVRVILDRDYRTAEESEALVQRLAASEVSAHIWERKELENYLLGDSVLARVSGLSSTDTVALSDEVLESMHDELQGQVLKASLDSRSSGEDTATALSRASAAFSLLWADRDRRKHRVPAKRFISAWNDRVASRGGKIVTPSKLASAITALEIASEMKSLLLEVERELS
jgi:predicted ATP-dependent endonuclease of OLD family